MFYKMTAKLLTERQQAVSFMLYYLSAAKRAREMHRMMRDRPDNLNGHKPE